MELSLNVVESLFISLIIPCIRPNTFPVVIHILKSAQSLAVFEKIMGRIPKVMPAIESSIRSLSMMTDEARLFQQLIDIIYALLDKFPVFNDSYKDIVSINGKLPWRFGHCYINSYIDLFVYCRKRRWQISRGRTFGIRCWTLNRGNRQLRLVNVTRKR